MTVFRTDSAQHLAAVEVGSNPSARSVLLLAPSTGLGGGIERYVSSVADGLDLLDVEVRRVDLYTGQPGGWVSKVAFVLRAVLEAARRSPSAVFVMHPNLYRVGRLTGRVARRPWFGWAYGAEVFDEADARRVVCRARSARRLVTISQFTAAALERGGAPQAGIEIVTPVLAREWWALLERPAPAKSPVPQVIAVSRLGNEAKAKGVDALLDLAAELRDAKRDFRLVIVGGGDALVDYERRIERDGLSGIVVLTGRIDDIELVEWLRNSWVFVLPSRVDATVGGGEGFGIVYVEAASAGLPVVGSSDGGAAEAVRDGVNGYAVDPRDRGAIVASVTELLEHVELRAEMGSAGQEWAKDEFGPHRMAQAMERLLDRALVDAGRAHAVGERDER